MTDYRTERYSVASSKRGQPFLTGQSFTLRLQFLFDSVTQSLLSFCTRQIAQFAATQTESHAAPNFTVTLLTPSGSERHPYKHDAPASGSRYYWLTRWCVVLVSSVWLPANGVQFDDSFGRDVVHLQLAMVTTPANYTDLAL